MTDKDKKDVSLNKIFDKSKEPKPKTQEEIEQEWIDEPKQVLGSFQPIFYCGNMYKTLHGMDGKRFRTLEEAVYVLLYKAYEKHSDRAWVYKFLNASRLGSISNKQYYWQRQSDENKENMYQFAHLQYQEDANGRSRKIAKQHKQLYGIGESKKVKELYPKDHPLRHPYLLVKIHKELGTKMVGEEVNRLLLFLTGCSVWLCKKPLGIGAKGESSVGKSFTADQTLMHFPSIYKIHKKENNEFVINDDPAVFHLQEVSDAFLFRTPSEFWDRKIINFGELPEKPTDSELKIIRHLRQLQSEGYISKGLISDSVGKDGKKYSDTLYVKADISFIAMTAAEFEEQYANRQLLLSFDESKEQTERITKFRSEIDQYPHVSYIRDRVIPSKFIKKVVDGLPFKQFDHITYVNPYADILHKVTFNLWGSYTQFRRLFNFICTIVEVITRLHWLQRPIIDHPKVETGRIIKATGEDNMIALGLVWNSLEQSLIKKEVSDQYFFDTLKEVINSGKMDVEKDKEIIKKDGTTYIREGTWWSQNKLRKHIEKGKDYITNKIKRLQGLGMIKTTKIYGNYWMYSINESYESSKTLDSTSQSSILAFFEPAGMLTELRLTLRSKLPNLKCAVNLHEMPIFELLTTELKFPQLLINILYNIGRSTHTLSFSEFQRSYDRKKEHSGTGQTKLTSLVSEAQTSVSKSVGLLEVISSYIKSQEDRLNAEVPYNDVYSYFANYVTSNNIETDGKIKDHLNDIIADLEKEGEIVDPKGNSKFRKTR